ncbi:MAG: hypothetical protein LBH90_00750 [Tannerella sp.]|jgi:hypothetical protein|nr:hypothetical protein [Tannerella sp.]
MKITLKVLLGVAIVLLAYMCYCSIIGPIEFDKERGRRESAIQARLIDIRTVQIEYRNLTGQYAGSFDELKKFLKETKLPSVRKEGVLSDEQLEQGMTEAEALKKGIIKRDTTWVLAKDTLLGAGYNVDSLSFVPVAGVNAAFLLDTATLESPAGYSVKVFESGVKYDTYLFDLDRQQLVNLKDKMGKMGRYLGLRVGSVTEINNNAGNWEQ